MHRTRLEAARNCGAGAAPETALWGPKARLAAHPRPETDRRPPPTAAAARPAARSRRTCQRGAQWTPPWPRAGAPAAAQRPPPSGNRLPSWPAGTPARPGTGLASGRDRFCPVDLVNTECQRHSRAGKKMLYLPLRLLEPQHGRRQKRSLGGKAGQAAHPRPGADRRHPPAAAAARPGVRGRRKCRRGAPRPSSCHPTAKPPAAGPVAPSSGRTPSLPRDGADGHGTVLAPG